MRIWVMALGALLALALISAGFLTHNRNMLPWSHHSGITAPKKPPPVKKTGKRTVKTKAMAPDETISGRHKMCPSSPMVPGATAPKLGQGPERAVHSGYIPWPQKSPEGGGWISVGNQMTRVSPHSGFIEWTTKPIQSTIKWTQSEDGTVFACSGYGQYGTCPPGARELKLK